MHGGQITKRINKNTTHVISAKKVKRDKENLHEEYLGI